MVRKLRYRGYKVERQEFEFFTSLPQGPSTLEQLAPGSKVYVEDTDYALMSQTDPGNIASAVVEAVDLSLATPADSTSGCEPADFGTFTSGNIALVQRGACSFQQKAENAANVGAVGVIKRSN